METSPVPDSMHVQRLSFGGTTPLIAFYALVSKPETQLASLASVFLGLSAK